MLSILGRYNCQRSALTELLLIMILITSERDIKQPIYMITSERDKKDPPASSETRCDDNDGMKQFEKAEKKAIN
ncbi:hypothetical protein GBA52_008701 [Prunus armeniaca]|nr:hypothetical protein GBA52_008701 [Prunus armeniaca]